MDEKEKIKELIASGQLENIMLAVELAFALNIDIEAEKLIKIYHQIYPTQIYQPDKKQKIITLLSQNKIELQDLLPDNLWLLPNLRFLILKSLDFFKMPLGELYRLLQIDSLMLYRIQVEELGYRFQYMNSLQRINLSGCRINIIHKDFCRAPNLELIEFMGTAIGPFLPFLPNCKALKTLKISRQKLNAGELQALEQLQQLEKLDFIHCDLKSSDLEKLSKKLKNCQVKVYK